MRPIVNVRDLWKIYRKETRKSGLRYAIKSLFKPQYSEIEALKGISFEVYEGEMVGFVGPNGAGKTTTMKIISGVIYPSSGTVEVLGYVPTERNPEFLKNIALFMGQKGFLSIVIWDLPPVDGFELICHIYGIPHDEYRKRLDFFVDLLDLKGLIETPLRKLSLGERTKVELAAALLHFPKLVILDEPTIGLDIVSQAKLRDFLKEYNKTTNATIILTSHYIRDVEDLARRLIVIHHGEIIFDGPQGKIIDRMSKTRTIRIHLNPSGASPKFDTLGKIIETDSESVTIEVERERVRDVARVILNFDAVLDIAIQEPPLEDVLRTMFTREEHIHE